MAQDKPASKADEVEDLLEAVKSLILPFIQHADDATAELVSPSPSTSSKPTPSTLVDLHPPRELSKLFKPDFPDEPSGKDGLMQMVEQVLKYSVNTWHPGFMDKLYASTNAVGVVSELLLSVLNTNVHVYQVSPALTIIEKTTAKALASLYGLTGPHAGGIAQPGGSASNQSSMVIARNYLYPRTKSHGLEGQRFVLFTSAHGHYSLEKAAQMFGFGMNAVRGVAVDKDGKMRADELDRMITEAKEKGEVPFYVNATAGTTVLGSYDPIDELADVCEKHCKIWLHIDGSWGGPAIFSRTHRYKLKGSHRVNSIGVTPHKMLSLPMTSSFLLAQDLRQFHKAMTLPAGYLFHNSDEADLSPADGLDGHAAHNGSGNGGPEERVEEFWDLADLTPQCGRRGDALKLALSWIYYGTSGLEAKIDNGFTASAHLAHVVASNPKFTLVSANPPPCWQVCFYYNKKEGDSEYNSRMTEGIAKKLISRGFMVDYAPGEEGKFFRVVVNGGTLPQTSEKLIECIENIGSEA